MDLPQLLQERTSVIERACGALLVSKDGRLLMQLRDDKPGINFPGMVGAFGGAADPGELPIEAATRELDEETNLQLPVERLKPFVSYKTKQYNGHDLLLFIFIVENVDDSNLHIYEGQRVYEVTDPNDPLICPNTVRAVKQWFDQRG